jgi:hypothetical protein
MKKENLEFVAMLLGFFTVVFLFGGLSALFFNYVIGLFVEYPVTWSNWGKTWLAIICFNMLFNRTNKGD